MSRRKSQQSCPRRLGCETGYARGEREGSWWPPSEDTDRALFDVWSVAVNDTFASGVADLYTGKGVLQDRIRAPERVEAKPAAGEPCRQTRRYRSPRHLRREHGSRKDTMPQRREHATWVQRP